MKEKLNVRRGLFKLASTFSPFGAVMIRPPKGSTVDVVDVTDEKASVSATAGVDEKKRVIIPTGASARVFIYKGDNTARLRVVDYCGGTGHTPGAKITGDAGIDIVLNPKHRKEFVPGVGYISYKKAITKTKK